MGVQIAINPTGWILALLCSAMIGMSKTGIAGIGMLAIPLMAFEFGGMRSSGLVLPMLLMADIFAVIFYHRNAQWKYILRILPAILIGIGIGLLVGTRISDIQFKKLIGICVILSLLIMIWKERKALVLLSEISTPYSMLFGILGGFSTMIGNAAGPILAVYLLSIKLPKNEYIGTGAWLFMTVNLIKFPLQLLVWKNMDQHTLLFDLYLLPAIATGALLGVFLVRKISETGYKTFDAWVTFASALLLFI
jgi:uncharacterized protein